MPMRPSSNVISLDRPAAAPAPDLARTVAAETAEVGALVQILRQEQQALLARDFERVYAMAVSKRAHLANLGALNAARATMLGANGLSPDNAGMLAAANRSSALRQPWDRLLALVLEARQINLVNGRLIATAMRFTTGALAALEHAASHFATYGADGQTQTAPASRTLASV